MADKRITDFSELLAILDNDMLLVSSGGETYKVSFGTIKNTIINKRVTNISYSRRASNGHLWGDANGDGVVNNQDGILVSRYIGQYPGVSIDTVACDLHGDGVVGNDDLITLQKYITMKGGDENKDIVKTIFTYDDDSTETFFGLMDR